MADPNDIIKTCVTLRKLATNAGECNAFVTAVAAHYGLPLSGNADQIIDEITKASLGAGLAAARKSGRGNGGPDVYRSI